MLLLAAPSRPLLFAIMSSLEETLSAVCPLPIAVKVKLVYNEPYDGKEDGFDIK